MSPEGNKIQRKDFFNEMSCRFWGKDSTNHSEIFSMELQSLVQSSVVWFFQFFKNCVGSGSLKTTESKNCQFRLFQKPYRTSGFDERADSFLAGSLTFSYVFRTMVIYQNGFFEYFENW